MLTGARSPSSASLTRFWLILAYLFVSSNQPSSIRYCLLFVCPSVACPRWQPVCTRYRTVDLLSFLTMIHAMACCFCCWRSNKRYKEYLVAGPQLNHPAINSGDCCVASSQLWRIQLLTKHRLSVHQLRSVVQSQVKSIPLVEPLATAGALAVPALYMP
ncbi:hypothetical protein LY78DRAFT_157229 [Colletotrichum sublineola]|nr:hypothetical protein LY78DRAFT_157229 [Colletotrichum sublineola]